MLPDFVSKRVGAEVTEQRVPEDLIFVFLFTWLTIGVVTLPVIRETAMRSVFASIFVFTVPGHLMISAIFPERDTPSSFTVENAGTISWKERIAMTLITSVLTIGYVGFVVDLLPIPFETNVLILTAALTVFPLLALAWVRRISIVADRRVRFPITQKTGLIYTRFLKPDSKHQFVVNLCVILVIAGAAGGAYVLSGNSADYTEFYVQNATENGTATFGLENGSYRGSLPVVVEHHGQSQTFTIIALAENETDSQGWKQTEIHHSEISVADGERVVRDIPVRMPNSSDRQRLRIQLFQGDQNGPVDRTDPQHEAYVFLSDESE